MAKVTRGKRRQRSVKKKVKRSVPTGIAHIFATFNNTVISFSDEKGNIISWATGGTAGNKGSRKSTPFAAQMAADQASKSARDAGMNRIIIEVKGPGQGREAAIKTIAASGIEITGIRDVTPIPHNGCRPRKKRRV